MAQHEPIFEPHPVQDSHYNVPPFPAPFSEGHDAHKHQSKAFKDSEKGVDISTASISSDLYPITLAQTNCSGPQEGEVEFRTMSWWHAGLLMIAEIISLGILSLPSAFAALGMIPSICVVIIFGIIATYAGYIIGQFKLRHSHVTSFADAGEILLGSMGWPRLGRELFAIAKVLFLVFISAAHILTFGITMNVLTNHGACTVAFTAVAAVLSMVLCAPRTLKNVSYLSIASCLSIFSAVMLILVYVGVKDPDWGPVYLGLPPGVTVIRRFVAISNITLAYSGNVAFFGFFSELKDPRSFSKALLMLQSCTTTLYLLAGAFIYAFVGADVPSPALGAASPTVRRVAYALALPTVLVAGVINGHVAARYLLNRMCASNPRLIVAKSTKARLRWAAVVVVLWTVAWLLAELIPVFNSLLALVAAFFGSWFTYGLGGWLGLHLRGPWQAQSCRGRVMALVDVSLLLLASVLCVMGMYGAVASLLEEAPGAVFGCADDAPPIPVHRAS